jgi:hypothetical protein
MTSRDMYSTPWSSLGVTVGTTASTYACNMVPPMVCVVWVIEVCCTVRHPILLQFNCQQIDLPLLLPWMPLLKG